MAYPFPLHWHPMLLVACLAGLGGWLYGLGVLGNRLGVQGCTNENRTARCAITILVLSLSTVTAPTIDLFAADHALVAQTFGDPEWAARIPAIVASGVAIGASKILMTLAFAYSLGDSSAMISVIVNGTYTLCSAAFIAVLFREVPGPLSYLAAAFIVSGIFLAEATSGRGKTPGEDGSLSDSDREEDEARSPGGKRREDPLEGDNDRGSVLGEGGPTSKADARAQLAMAPTALRRRAVVLAILAGMCRGFGPVGKRYGVFGAPEGHDRVRSTCTFFISCWCGLVPPLLKTLWTDSLQRSEAIRDPRFRELLAGVVACGLLTGCGGMLNTLAFAIGGAGTGPLVSVIENGMGTVAGALMITLVFRERPTKMHILSAVLVVTGLGVSALSP